MGVSISGEVGLQPPPPPHPAATQPERPMEQEGSSQPQSQSGSTSQEQSSSGSTAQAQPGSSSTVQVPSDSSSTAQEQSSSGSTAQAQSGSSSTVQVPSDSSSTAQEQSSSGSTAQAQSGSSSTAQAQSGSSSAAQVSSGSEQDKTKPPDSTTDPQAHFMLQSLSMQLEQEELWTTLSECLNALAETHDPHAVLVLQPTVEAFFLVHAGRSEDSKPLSRKSRSSRSRFGRLSSFHTISDTESSNPASPASHLDFSSMPSTPGLDSEQDPYAHLPPDTARFLKFAGVSNYFLDLIFSINCRSIRQLQIRICMHKRYIIATKDNRCIYLYLSILWVTSCSPQTLSSF